MSAEDLPDLLSVKETAAYIRSPQPTVYYLIKEGKIPAIRIGGRWRVKRKELDEMYGPRICDDEFDNFRSRGGR